MNVALLATAAALAAVVVCAVLVLRLQSRVDALVLQLGARSNESAALAGQLTAQVSSQLAHLAERIGRLDEATRQVERVGQSIVSLEQLLAAPKLRGNLGEWSLDAMLAEVLPAQQYVQQHRLGTRGVIVDAAVRTAGERWLPIDSKFPVESYRRLVEAERLGQDTQALRGAFVRAVRARVDEIAAKYISPDDHTLDFALLYVPAESVYYEIAVRDSGHGLLEYARDRHVLFCSPNTLYAYLQALAVGMRGATLAREIREVLAILELLRQDTREAQELFGRATTQLRFAAGNLESARGALERIDGHVRRALDGRQEAELAEALPPAP